MLALVVAAALSGCFGESPSLDEQRPMSLVIKTPELDGEIIFSDQDASALDLDERVWGIRSIGDRGSTRIPTGLTQSSNETTEYCFSEPVTLASSTSERLLIQPGECFGGVATTMDREGVRFTSPLANDVVGDVVDVQVAYDVGTPDSTARFYVDGESSTQVTDAEGRVRLDLSPVAPGAVALRVEVVDPNGRIRAANVIEIVKADPPS